MVLVLTEEWRSGLHSLIVTVSRLLHAMSAHFRTDSYNTTQTFKKNLSYYTLISSNTRRHSSHNWPI